MTRNAMRESRGRSRRGAAAIEFGFWVTIIFTLFAGTIDFGWYMSRAEAVSRAAKEGARAGAFTRGTDAAIRTAAVTRANETLAGLYPGCSINGGNVDITTNGQGFRTIQVNVTCNNTALIGFVPTPAQVSYSLLMYTEEQ